MSTQISLLVLSTGVLRGQIVFWMFFSARAPLWLFASVRVSVILSSFWPVHLCVLAFTSYARITHLHISFLSFLVLVVSCALHVSFPSAILINHTHFVAQTSYFVYDSSVFVCVSHYTRILGWKHIISICMCDSLCFSSCLIHNAFPIPTQIMMPDWFLFAMQCVSMH